MGALCAPWIALSCASAASTPGDAGADAGRDPVVEISTTTGTQTAVCARREQGSVVCRAIDTSETWTAIERDAVQISVLGRTGCARMRDGTVKCWLDISSNQNAYHQWAAIDVPVHDVVEVTGGTTGCARLQGGEVWCWDGTLPAGSGPPVIAPPTRWIASGAARVAMTEGRRTALFVDGHLEDNRARVAGATDVVDFAVSSTALCWRSRGGEVGCSLDPLIFESIPSPPDFSVLRDSTAFAVGRRQLCGVAADGSVSCIGDALDGFAGGTYSPPAVLQGLTHVSQLVAGGWRDDRHSTSGIITCGLMSGDVYCVGQYADNLGATPTYHAAAADFFASLRDR